MMNSTLISKLILPSLHTHKYITIKFRLLQNFNFTNKHIMKRINGLTGFFNITTNTIWNSTKWNGNGWKLRYFIKILTIFNLAYTLLTNTYNLLTTSFKSFVPTSWVIMSTIFFLINFTCECLAYDVFLIWLVRLLVKPMQNNLKR